MMTDDQRSARAPQEARGVAPGQRAYLFVGERPSPRAAAMEVCWEDGRLCAATLFRALEAAGIDPLQQICGRRQAWDGRLKKHAWTRCVRRRRSGARWSLWAASSRVPCFGQESPTRR